MNEQTYLGGTILCPKHPQTNGICRWLNQQKQHVFPWRINYQILPANTGELVTTAPKHDRHKHQDIIYGCAGFPWLDGNLIKHPRSFSSPWMDHESHEPRDRNLESFGWPIDQLEEFLGVTKECLGLKSVLKIWKEVFSPDPGSILVLESLQLWPFASCKYL